MYLGRRGGGAIYSLEVAKALSQRCQVVAAISKQADNLDDWHASGIELIEVATYTNSFEFIGSSINLFKFRSLANDFKNFVPDIIYYPMLHLWSPIINCFLPQIPKVITVHDPILHSGEQNLLVDFTQRASIKQAERIIILSKTFIEVMEKQGVPKEKIDVIPHGEFSFYKKGEQQNLENKDPRILFFGRISPYKGIGVLLDAFGEIKEQLPTARLTIAGEGDMEPYAVQLSNLSDVEVINRWISDEEVSRFFEEADLLAVPYIDASQSGVIPIAYSFGMPVVATNTGGLSEQVTDQETGILVPPKDSQALAQACIELLTNKAKREKMGKAGYKKAKHEWSWDAIAESVYKSCTKAINK